ncbi:LuxR C-terminal-related transcriptional regulator [Mycobacterium asiaticum]|uniref:LuxR C-terminal-related transcriptional regulator n=1 Tax=Mycobacterium asiaticum TaxID=1790 RepID=UPI0007F03C4F|nr:LuxR C-terminal-related transcriptional regulator [Mycobacterium asiaticum]OBI88707.1 transcriptional regulator [Mycobacterium asiaticum]
MSETSWSVPEMSELPTGLPTGTVTLLLADVEGSTRLWETQPEAMRDAVARLDAVLAATVASHRGVRPVEQGEGDSFVIAFTRAADAVSCALDLQRAPLAPIKLRIGVHTGDIYLRDEGNYIGPTINRTARLRDLAHGGQTVLSGATEPLVLDHLPADVTLTDLGTHPLRDLPRPERVVQLSHPDLHNDFPPLRTVNTVAAQRLPTQLTSFVGRESEMRGIRDALAENRLVTLTGAGGAGKTRLAVQVAASLATEFADGISYVDLAPITDPDAVPLTVARALGVPDQPGEVTIEMLRRCIRDRQMLVLVDNCEHLLDASADLLGGLLAGCPALTLLTTSRESIGVGGELSWRVPSLSLPDEAVELFADRARRIRPEFRVSDDNAETLIAICRRLDGLPLAIELAAARIRALSPAEILRSLHDTFRLLTGGARTAVRRQQTLRASVDWSHELLSEAERVLFRRLAVFLGGFDLDAAQAVSSGERFQVLDQLTLLVDKSLVVADDSPHGTRYRLLETVRQYALEKLGESREGDDVRCRHRDHYTAIAGRLETSSAKERQQRIDVAGAEIDNLRAAFAWSRENGDTEQALSLASSLLPLWLNRGLMQEGVKWLDAALADADSPDEASPGLIRAMVTNVVLGSFRGLTVDLDYAEHTLAAARELGEPALVARALTGCACRAAGDRDLAVTYFTEAADIARACGDSWWLGQTVALEAVAALLFGEPVAGQRAAQEALRIADAIGERFVSRQSRYVLGWAQVLRGDLAGALPVVRAVDDEATAARDGMYSMHARSLQALILAYQGQTEAAEAAAKVALARVTDLFDTYSGVVYAASAVVQLAMGDGHAASEAFAAARKLTPLDPQMAGIYNWAALAPLAYGDLAAARRWADEVVAATTGWSQAASSISRAFVEIAQGESDAAERDAYRALDLAAHLKADLLIPFALDCLATVATGEENHTLAARLFGAADAARQRMRLVRYQVLDPGIKSRVAAARDALGNTDFDAARAEGAALSNEEAIAYALRRRGERTRASSGWSSLTRAELDVVKLVSEGLPNRDVATRLFISPRTVQAHLTHIYTKLGLTSRVQLAQEAARHG